MLVVLISILYLKFKRVIFFWAEDGFSIVFKKIWEREYFSLFVFKFRRLLFSVFEILIFKKVVYIIFRVYFFVGGGGKNVGGGRFFMILSFFC